MPSIYIGVLVLLACILIARFVSEASLKLLSVEEKARLLDVFASMRKYNMLILFVIIGATFGAYSAHLIDGQLFNIAYISLCSIYLAFISVFSYRTLRKNNFPDQFIRKSVFATALRITGFILFMIVLFAA